MTTTLSATHRDSARLSTYSSGAPSLHPSIATSDSTAESQPQAQADKDTLDHGNDSNLAYQSTSSTMTYDTDKITYHPGASTSTVNSTDARTQDIKSWSASFQRMQDERMDKQRYVMNDKKGAEVSIAALGAKVERALGRRMVGQDAVFTERRRKLPVELPEKRSLEVAA